MSFHTESIRRSTAFLLLRLWGGISNRLAWFWIGGFFFALAFLIYAPALSGSLIWDDHYLVGENPFFRSPVFGLEVFRHYLFFDSFSTYYRPIQNWSYIADYWLWHGDAGGYHSTNLSLHAGSALLLFFLLKRILPIGRGAANSAWVPPFLIASIWLVHPIHNAAVAYISGRADSLASLFALAAWLLVLRAGDAGSRAGRWMLGFAAGLSMLLALCSKEIALIWLALFVSHQWFFKNDSSRKTRWTATAGALVVLGLYAVLHALPAARMPMEDGLPAPFQARVLLMLRALGDYTGLIFWPAHLQMERALSNPDAYRSLALWQTNPRGEWLSILGLVVIIAAFQLCRWRAEGRALRLLGAGWFAIAFLPISNLFPLNAEVAEHWIYLASIGALIFLAGCVTGLPARMQRLAVVATVLAAAGLGWRTNLRSRDWVDAETFCAQTIAAGGTTPRMLSTLASIYGARGDLQPQEQLLRKMIARFPEFTTARINLGLCLVKQGRKQEAEEFLHLDPAEAEQSTRQFPRTWRAALALARMRREGGEPDQALRILREAHTRFPETWEIVKLEGEIVQADRGAPAALGGIERFAAAHWWHMDSWLTVGSVRSAAGEANGAVMAFEHATRLDIRDPRPLASIAEIEFDRGHLDAALDAQIRAMTRDPDQPHRYMAMSEILAKMGHRSEADSAANRARQLSAGADDR